MASSEPGPVTFASDITRSFSPEGSPPTRRAHRQAASRQASNAENGPNESLARYSDPHVKAILVDLGGVLLQMDWQVAAEAWEQALGHPSGTFLRAMFGGNDRTALVGKGPEEEWWDTVRGRLTVSADVLRDPVPSSPTTPTSSGLPTSS